MRYAHRAPLAKQATPKGGGWPPGIHELRPASVRRPHRPAHTGLVLRGQDQVQVVGHQAVGPHLHPRLGHLLGQDVEVELLVPVLEEDRLAPVTPRGDVVRAAGGDDAGHAPL